MELYFYILFVLILIAFYLDVRYEKIPNWLTVSSVGIGIIYHIIINGMQGLIFSMLGLLVGGGILLFLYLFKGVGAGDVKLFAAIGAISGMHFTLYALMYSIIFAGLIAVIILLFRRDMIKRLFQMFNRLIRSIFTRNMKDLEQFKRQEAVRFPFMYAVLPGIIMTTFYFLQ